jgi:YYY domain-containing protein
VVSGAVILFTNLVVYNFRGKAVWVTVLQGAAVFGLSWLVCLPFTIKFDQISTNPLLCVNHTPLNQLIILWGLPFYVVISFLCFLAYGYFKKKKSEPEQEQSERKASLFSFMKNLTSSDLFIITLGLCAIGLVLIPEVIYIEDIYSGDYKRANTMFKLTYQAFIMFGICFGYIMLRLLAFGETARQKRAAVISLILFAFSVCYAQNAVNAWYGNIFHIDKYKGLDCTTFMKTNDSYTDDVEAINWLNDNITGVPVVLEANGDSYSDYERVSVMTGFPTVLGWRTHEWLWKSDTNSLDERSADIETIYTSTDENEVRQLLKKYDVSYIYVGKLEQEKYSALNHALIKSLGTVVYISPITSNKDYETYIVKIK